MFEPQGSPTNPHAKPGYDPTVPHRYIVTLRKHDDLDSFYVDMENVCSSKAHIPFRAVECKARRPGSRNTEYDLTSEEAATLRHDHRVLAVEIDPVLVGASFGPTVTQHSQYFNKSSVSPYGNAFTSASNVWINWGLLRVSEGEARPGWGGAGTGNTMASGNVVINTMGRNVDVVVCDTGIIPYNHPEYAVNPDGTGGSRVVQFNWYQYNAAVNGQSAGTYNYDSEAPYSHSTHVAGTVAGNTQGWARGASIYTCPYGIGGGSMAGSYCFQYIQQFHINKGINPETGIKNPTVVNNSWGWSIFPSQWSFADITQVTYRGVTYTPGGTVRTSGYCGICGNSAQYADLGTQVLYSGYSITTGDGNATVTGTSNVLNGTSGLSVSTTPTFGNNDDGYWLVSLPWMVNFQGVDYSTVYMGTNWYLTFGGGSTAFANISSINPPLPKICVCAGDRYTSKIYQGVSGTVGSRIYIIRVEGNSLSSLTSTNTVFEVWFYENQPTRIDVKVGMNGTATNGSFTAAQLNSWGFIEGQRIPYRVASIDADVIDAINSGVIMVGAAGNGAWKHDVHGGEDWDNTFMMNNRYPGQVYHYMRGSTPTANDSSMGMVNICVGAAGYTLPETKASFSDCGPGTDLYSPGHYISSSYTATATDPRNRSYYQGKLSGTSMASPQVCGVVASALEVYPRWRQQDAKTWLLQQANPDQLTAGNGGPTDLTDLQGGDNLYLSYPTIVPTEGQVVPTPTYGNVPDTGQVYPRPRIFIYGGG